MALHLSPDSLLGTFLCNSCMAQACNITTGHATYCLRDIVQCGNVTPHRRPPGFDEVCPLQGPTLHEAICVALAPVGDMTSSCLTRLPLTAVRSQTHTCHH